MLPNEYQPYQRHRRWMAYAVELAIATGEVGEVPVAAVVVDGQDCLVSAATNRQQRDRDPTAHAEMLAIRQATQKQQNRYLTDCTLYVTLEPCAMCAGAIVHARLQVLVYGADDPKTGAIRTVANLPDSALSNHRLSVWGGILESDCRRLLQDWFGKRRLREGDEGEERIPTNEL